MSKIYHYSVRDVAGQRHILRCFYARKAWQAFPVLTVTATETYGPVVALRHRSQLRYYDFSKCFSHFVPAPEAPGAKRAELTPEFKAEREALHAAGDDNFCVPVALGFVLGVPAHRVDAELRKAGLRRHRKGVNPLDYRHWLQKLGCRLVTRYDPAAGCSRTAVSAEVNLPRGRFLISYRGHVAALIDGQLHDWTRGTRKKVLQVIEVFPPALEDLPAELRG